jgi:hypothetical protein
LLSAGAYSALRLTWSTTSHFAECHTATVAFWKRFDGEHAVKPHGAVRRAFGDARGETVSSDASLTNSGYPE